MGRLRASKACVARSNIWGLKKLGARVIETAARVRLALEAPIGAHLLQRQRAAYETLYACLRTTAQLMAPLAPFFADWLWRNLGGEASVHLTDLPDGKLLDEDDPPAVLAVLLPALLFNAALVVARRNREREGAAY